MVKVISVEPIENHKLRVLLSNNKKGIFDVSPYLDKGVFKELRDPQYFRRVRVNYGGVTWPHEQDFSAETIEYELQREQSPNNPFWRTAFAITKETLMQSSRFKKQVSFCYMWAYICSPNLP